MQGSGKRTFNRIEYSEKAVRKLLSRVVVNGDCWEDRSPKNSTGRPTFHIGNKGTSSSRAAYLLFRGSIPDGMCVCHRCDNPTCVNPAHLFLGTRKDNTQDMITKGRRRCRCGGASRTAKLTDEAVAHIRGTYTKGRAAELAAMYGVSKRTIHRVLSHHAWRLGTGILTLGQGGTQITSIDTKQAA